jgi:hypothetical protein
VKQPAYIRGNVYAAGARPFEREQDALVFDGKLCVGIVEDGDEVYLQTELPEDFDRARTSVISGLDLERVRFADADFEERDGTPAIMDVDLVGEQKEQGLSYPAGPIAGLAAGKARVRVW